jgi:hypothetical protein
MIPKIRRRPYVDAEGYRHIRISFGWPKWNWFLADVRIEQEFWPRQERLLIAGKKGFPVRPEPTPKDSKQLDTFRRSPEFKTMKQFWDWQETVLEFSALHAAMEEYLVLRGRLEGFQLARQLLDQVADYNPEFGAMSEEEEEFYANMARMDKKTPSGAY